jgi:ABC-2 type transport system ATP-binding protein
MGIMSDAIIVKDLTKHFGSLTAVDNISFSVKKGEIFGFLGPNGAGKTTTTRMITGIIKPDAGDIQIFGYNMVTAPLLAKQKCGVVPETSNAYPDLTAWQNLMFMGEVFGFSDAYARRQSETLLRAFELTEHAGRKVQSFSKGMKQRLVLAMALLHEPEVLFLDEPTSGLDVSSSRLILSMLREMNTRGVTIFLTTHNMDEANNLCHQVGIIRSGKLIAIDSPEKLKNTIDKLHQVEVSFEQEISEDLLRIIPGIKQMSHIGDKWKISGDNNDALIRSLVRLSEREGLTIISLHTLAPTLDDVFLQLTGGQYS